MVWRSSAGSLVKERLLTFETTFIKQVRLYLRMYRSMFRFMARKGVIGEAGYGLVCTVIVQKEIH